MMRGWLTKLLGDRGEKAAVRFLRRLGYRILAKQYRCRIGEIDIVAQDGDRIVFVEVKTRDSTAAGHPTEAITHDKQKKLTQLGLIYLKAHGWLDRPARFDVVSIVWPKGAKQPQIDHYLNAFEAIGQGQMFC